MPLGSYRKRFRSTRFALIKGGNPQKIWGGKAFLICVDGLLVQHSDKQGLKFIHKKHDVFFGKEIGLTAKEKK